MKLLIRKPVISEKSVSQGTNANKYTFVVDPSASKPEVARAIEAMFKVSVKAINMTNIIGKTKRYRKIVGKRSNQKKAIVTLAAGQHINLFEESK